MDTEKRILYLLMFSPAGHTAHCISKALESKKLDSFFNRNHICHCPPQERKVDHKLQSLLRELVIATKIERVGAYYFRRSQ